MSLIIKLKSLLVMFFITLWLTGCGQKGALYLPDDKPAQADGAVTKDEEQDKKDQ